MNKKEEEVRAFISEHERALIPLSKELNEANWMAETSGTEEAFKRLEELSTKMRVLYSRKEDYEKLVSIQESSEVKDRLLARQLALLINSYRGNLLPKEILQKLSAKESEVTMKINNYRGVVDGSKVTKNQIDEVLDKSLDNEERRKHWEAQKAVGLIIEKPLRELVLLRNEAATRLGYSNFYEMSLDLQELEVGWLIKTFDRLYRLTKKPFMEAKSEIDSELRKRFNVKDIMPWHYSDPFFQACPVTANIGYEHYYGKQDIIPIARRFYNGIGLPIDSVLAKSDMYERPGKSQHAFCIDIDRKGDVRVLMNIRNHVDEMNTLLHELGHSAYSLGHDRSLPFILRDAAHTFTTEAVAMMFGDLAYNSRWMKEFFEIENRKAQRMYRAGKEMRRKEQLIFCMWVQVMLRFEKSMYEDPKQDLNSLWWGLVEKYQMVDRPEGRDMPDYASKNHICTAPVYYHNYQLGQMFAAQLESHINESLSKGEPWNNNRDIGRYLHDMVFSVGASMKWNQLVKYATGRKLDPKYFVRKFTK